MRWSVEGSSAASRCTGRPAPTGGAARCASAAPAPATPTAEPGLEVWAEASLGVRSRKEGSAPRGTVRRPIIGGLSTLYVIELPGRRGRRERRSNSGKAGKAAKSAVRGRGRKTLAGGPLGMGIHKGRQTARRSTARWQHGPVLAGARLHWERIL